MLFGYNDDDVVTRFGIPTHKHMEAPTDEMEGIQGSSKGAQQYLQRKGQILDPARPNTQREAQWLKANLLPEYGAILPEWPPLRRTGYPAGCRGRR